MATAAAAPEEAAPSSACPVSPAARALWTGGRPGAAAAAAAPAAVVSEAGAGVDPGNMMRAGGERNLPAPMQQMPLDTARQVSTIPKGEFNPETQDSASTAWEYPSPQMFFNAMRRKGYQPSEHDMGMVVAIHNAVNERTWTEVLRWEALHKSSCGDPKLLKFEGRPKDLTPRARINSLFGYDLPFDRHDWVVDRCGTEVRYVIDFYNAPGDGETAAIGMHLDVRPALDNLGAVADRVRMTASDFLGWQ